MTTSNGLWINWAGNLAACPSAILQPPDVAALQTIIKNNQGRVVRAVGTGHSWSPIAFTGPNDLLIDTSQMTENGSKAWRWQQNGLNLVTFVPSALWSDVRDALTTSSNPAPQMYLPTAGVLPSINATGFVAAGCHGTGWNQPTVSDLIYAIEIVAADGEVHLFSEDTTPAEMPIVRVSLGTLGVISKVTLKVVPLYHLHDQEGSQVTANVMGPNPESSGSVDPTALANLVVTNEYVELFWFPWSGWSFGSSELSDGQIWTKVFNTTLDPPRNVPPQPPDWQIWFADVLMAQVALWPTSSAARAGVPLVESGVWSSLSGSIAAIEKTDGYVGTAPEVLHYQDKAFPVIDLEMAVPIPPSANSQGWDFTNVVTAWYQVVNYVKAQYKNSSYPLTCCVHARFIKNSQSLLSPAYEPAGSDVHYCWIEFLSAYPKENCQPADLAPFQELIDETAPTWITQFKGRPHWGKYWQSIPGIRENIHTYYPPDNLTAFNTLRKQMDPDGMFLTAFLKGLNLFV